MYQKSRFALLQNTNDDNADEIHYKGGLAIRNDMIDHEKNKMQRGGSIEKHEYNEYENKVVPFSLAYNSSPDIIREGGDGTSSITDIEVIPEDIHNKLFFSVAREINEKGNEKGNKINGGKRKTIKKLK